MDYFFLATSTADPFLYSCVRVGVRAFPYSIQYTVIRVAINLYIIVGRGRTERSIKFFLKFHLASSDKDGTVD